LRVLAIDTALEACSVAVFDAGRKDGLTSRSQLMMRGHAEALMPMIAATMSAAAMEFGDLDRIAVTVGPGSFTGLRVGVAAARGIALATGKRAVGVTTLAVLAIALPSFVTGPLLALIFGLYLHWLPVAGWEAGEPRYLVLPVLTLALPIAAYLARLMRGSLLEVLRAPYVRSARARGLGGARGLWRHALRPALLPVVSYLGPAVAFAVTGSLVVETVFGLPGTGRYLVQGAIDRDYPLVMGMIIVYAVFTLLCNLLADLLYGWLDPGVRHD
jgi:oligopeptide transport system permease protein